ncbi:MAG: hypothetical protein AB1700_20085, partial [Bacillota bacterium]
MNVGVSIMWEVKMPGFPEQRPGVLAARESSTEASQSEGRGPDVAGPQGRNVIGKASATEREPNSSERFSFWLAPEEIVNPFDIVEADHMRGTRTFGLVTNIRQITDAPSHLSNFISNDFGSVEVVPQTPREGTNVAEVNVLANYDPSEPKRYPMGIYMPVQNDSPVYFADEQGIHVA